MPLTHVSRHWFIRITQPHDFIKTQLHDIEAWSNLERVIVVSHVGAKTKKQHVHILLTLIEERQHQSINVIFKKFFTEPRCISIKKWDGVVSGESALSYLWHDAFAQIVYNKGFSKEVIEQSRRVCTDVQAEVNKRKQRASGHCVSRILDEIVMTKEVWTEEAICMRILAMVRDGEIYEPGDFLIARYVNEIYSKQPQKRSQWLNWARGRVCKILRKDFLDIEQTECLEVPVVLTNPKV